MNYPAARRKARLLFGKTGDAQILKGSKKNMFKTTYLVGVVQDRKFIPLGAGASWDEAFNSVKEVQRGEEEGVRGSKVEGKGLVEKTTNVIEPGEVDGSIADSTPGIHNKP